MNDYDACQYRMMQNQIRMHEEGRVGLNGLISNLEALMVCLTAPDDVWLTDFRNQWGILRAGVRRCCRSTAGSATTGFRNFGGVGSRENEIETVRPEP